MGREQDVDKGGIVVVSKTVSPATKRSLEVLKRRSNYSLSFGSDVMSDPSVLDVDDVVAVVVPVPHERDKVAELAQMIREAAPTVLVCGSIDVPDQRLWLVAERSGFNLVSSDGAIGGALLRRLASSDSGRREAIAVMDSSDSAGRLGLLGTFDVDGKSVAIWRSGGRLGCLENACTHSGAALSEGEVEEGVVTCPRHGSRFDICSGERVRGPADTDVAHYDIFDKDGRIWVVPS